MINIIKNTMFYSEKKNIIAYIFTCAFLVVNVYVVLASFLFPNNDFLHYKVVYIFISVVLSSFIYYQIYRACKKITIRNRFLFNILFLIVMLPLQYFLFFNTYYQPGWDVSNLTEAGYWLACNMGIPPSLLEYFACYPNNVTLLMIWTYATKIAIRVFGYNDYLMLAIMLSCLMADLSVLLISDIVRTQFSEQKSVFVVFIRVPFISFAPWMLTPYSDTMSILYPVFALWLYIKMKNFADYRKYIAAAIIGISVCFGMFIKPTVVIILIAIFIAEICLKHFDKKHLLCAAIIIISFICTYIPLNSYRTAIMVNSGVSEEHIEEVKFPLTHFLMMGMQKQASMFDSDMYQYGKWFGDDVNMTYAQVGQKAKIKANLDEIKERLSEFGLFGYIKFLSDKTRWVMGDGTMYFGGEVMLDASGFQQTPVAKFLQKFILYNGEYYFITQYILEGIWGMILVLCAAPIFNKNDKYDDSVVFILRLAICGIILFILMFEGRSRYLTNYIPLFIILAMNGINENKGELNVR